MRTITNLAGLPDPVYRALASNNYVGGGDISATRIIAPPRIVALRKFHEDEIVEDASDRIWSVLGSAGHKVLEMSATDEEIVETRLSMPFDGIKEGKGFLRWTVTGQPDLYQPKNRAIYDYKYTSVWSVLSEKTDWEKQVNIQAMLHRYQKDLVEQGFIVAFMRDWQVRKAKFEKNYPPVQAKVISIPLWPNEEAIDYVSKRVRLHQKAQKDYMASGFDADVLPMCSEDERWYRGHGYAVKKQDKNGKINKKADRVFTSLTDARQFMVDNTSTLPKGKSWAPIEERKGENIRCMDYCDVWAFCPFGRKLREDLQSKAAEEATEEEE